MERGHMRNLIRFLIAFHLLWSGAAFSESERPTKPLQSGFSEILITTTKPGEWITFLTADAGWEIRHRRPLVTADKNLLELSNHIKGESILLANKGSDRGFIRLILLKNIKQDHIRIDDRPWDTGGIFDFNMRVVGLYKLRERLLTKGWHGDSEPIRYVFGPFEVIEWIARGPDGVRIAFIERLKPALEGWPNVKATSRVFNSTTVVKDMKTSRTFFEKVLGMKPYLVSNKPSDKAGPNVLGLPHNIATMISRDVVILHPNGKNDGSVELLQFVGATGTDYSDRAKPRNLGISALRFPVEDLNESLKLLSDAEVQIATGPVEMTLEPYGKIRIAGINSPDGVRLEIFEITEKDQSNE
ncbi:MAG: VOC family protein [Parasphingorhabdus sp.]